MLRPRMWVTVWWMLMGVRVRRVCMVVKVIPLEVPITPRNTRYGNHHDDTKADKARCPIPEVARICVHWTLS